MGKINSLLKFKSNDYFFKKIKPKLIGVENMNTKNDAIVILTVLNLLKNNIEYKFNAVKDILRTYTTYKNKIDNRLLDNILKTMLLIVCETPVYNLTSKEDYTPIYNIVEKAFQELINPKLKINMIGELECEDCDFDDVINKLLSFDTLINTHKYILENYPMVASIIANQLIQPDTQLYLGIKKPINFTTYILKGEFTKIIPKEQLEYFNISIPMNES